MGLEALGSGGKVRTWTQGKEREERCRRPLVSGPARRIKNMQGGREVLPKLDCRTCRMPGRFRRARVCQESRPGVVAGCGHAQDFRRG